MKYLSQLLPLIVGVLFSSISFAQTVNGVKLDSINSDYVEIVGTQRLLSTKVTIDIQFGQQDKIFSARDTDLRDSEGRQVVFNSMIDALNFMSKNGYEFVQAYVVTIGNQNVYHYLMMKKEKEE